MMRARSGLFRTSARQARVSGEGGSSGTAGVRPPQAVSGHTQLLHDGRARNLLEAILWHGGEAQRARDAVAAMTPADRAALLTFLESL